MVEESKGQYILMSASPNLSQWSSTVRSFGALSDKFLKSRIGACLINQWHKAVDKMQKNRPAEWYKCFSSFLKVYLHTSYEIIANPQGKHRY